MKPLLLQLLLLGVIVFQTLLTSQCSSKKTPLQDDDPYAHFRLSPAGIPGQGQQLEEADSASLAQMAQESSMPLSIGTKPEDFVYEEVFANVPGSGPLENRWLKDHAQGLALARSQFKPLIVWFSHPKAPSDRSFDRDVLQHEDVLRAARGATIRVRLDFSDTKRASSKLYKQIKSQYGARGIPYLAIVLPDGTKINEFSGYRDTSRDGFVQNLVRSIQEAEAQIAQRQEQLAKNDGYRWWQGAQSQRAFAKALQYDQKSERVALRGMWGEQWIVSVLNFQEKDQLYLARWIIEQEKTQASTR